MTQLVSNSTTLRSMTGALATPREIPLSQLVASAANVRKVRASLSIDDLAEDIVRRGLLQSLSVRPVINDAGNETGQFAVQAGGRRLAALQKLQAEGRISPDHLIPCLVKSTGIEVEDSLAENVMRAGLHPLDQFRAFKALADDEGLSVDEIAARFFVSPQVVRQRLKLASASLTLLAAYAEDEMTLDQLMAFCVTADHARQESVWEQIRHGFNKEPYLIRRLLTEGAVKGNDRRVLFVGAAAYEAAGGLILRDLFSEDGGGWFQDVALLDRLATEKLAEEAKAIAAHGWKWVETALSFPYGHLNGLIRLSATPALISPDEQARYDAALAEYNALSEEFEGVEELPEEIDQRMGELEDILARVDERPEIFNPQEIAHAGVFVSIEHDGRLRIEAGYVRSEDRVPSTSGQSSGNPATGQEPALSGQSGSARSNTSEDADDVETETTARLSDRLVAELTAYRTLALREAAADDPDTALLALTHALVLKSFYRFAGSETCLELDIRSVALEVHAADLGESDIANRMSARQARWAGMLPKNPADLWDTLVAFDADSLAALFAWCVSTGINALQVPHIRRTRELAHADRLPSPEAAELALATIFEAATGLFAETRLEPDLPDLLWSLVNLFHRQTERMGRLLDDNEIAQRNSQGQQDGSEVRSVELERLTALGLSLIERRNAFEYFRDSAANLFAVETGSTWRPRTGSIVNHRALTSAMIDSRDFINARKLAETTVLVPAGHRIGFAGGTDYNDHTRIWDILDKTRAKHANMVLLHGGGNRGAERIAACWAESRKVPQVIFKPDWSKHRNAAPFKRNDQLLEAMPIGLILFPGSGVVENLGDKARKLGIPVWKCGAGGA